MAITLIRKAWLVSRDQWEHCNEIFHEEGGASALLDLPHINQEIQREWKLGMQDLPKWKHFYFKTELADLCKTVAHYRIEWLRKVITARKRTKR